MEEIADGAPLPETEAGTASVEGGYIVLDGPDGTAVTMTIEAAAGTAESLLDAVRKAREDSGL